MCFYIRPCWIIHTTAANVYMNFEPSLATKMKFPCCQSVSFFSDHACSNQPQTTHLWAAQCAGEKWGPREKVRSGRGRGPEKPPVYSRRQFGLYLGLKLRRVPFLPQFPAQELVSVSVSFSLSLNIGWSGTRSGPIPLQLRFFFPDSVRIDRRACGVSDEYL
jgi:hypothetical protein